MSEGLDALSLRMRACRVCEAHLPLGPNPVFRLSATARLLMPEYLAPKTKTPPEG